MFNFHKKNIYIIIMLSSFFTISSALYIEHFLSVPACKLCLYQRVPHILSIIICFFGIFFLRDKIWSYLLILTFFCSIAISGYHAGIENGIFNEFSGCTNGNLNIIDRTELLKSLNDFSLGCKNVSFRLFGFSLATINLILSIALMIITIKYIYNEKNA